MHTKFPSFVAGGRHDAALVRPATNDHRLAAQFGPFEQLDGHKKRVHVHVEDRGRWRKRMLIHRSMNRSKSCQLRHSRSLRFRHFSYNSDPYMARKSLGASIRMLEIALGNDADFR